MDAREKLQKLIDLGVKYPYLIKVLETTQPRLRHYTKGRTVHCPVDEMKIHQLYDYLTKIL